MWALILVLFVQNNLDVQDVNIRIDSKYQIETECWANVQKQPVVLPLQPGNAARWQYATCVKVLP